MAGRVRVANKGTEHPRVGEYTYYVGRPTALGNPFKAYRESQRDTVVDRYDEWLRTRMRTDNQVSRRVLEMVGLVKSGHNITLQCWCAPKRCHADVIKKVMEELMENDNA